MSKWTDDRVDLLKRLWGEGKTAKEIAQILGGGLTRNAVIGKAHRLKLSGRISPIQQNKSEEETILEEKARVSGKLLDVRPTGAAKKVEQSRPATPQPLAKKTGLAPAETRTTAEQPQFKKRAVPAEANEAQGAGVQLADIKERMCRWPIGDPKHDDFHFCGAMSSAGLPYCEVHAKIAYNVNLRGRSININEAAGKNRRDEADELLNSMANAS
ncbi:MAG: GcrA family cell cycle regulator [Pseudobdellovibrionaceae bacterium]